MRTGLKMILTVGCGVLLVQSPAPAEDKPAFKDDKEKASYGIGVNIGSNLKRSSLDVDVDVLAGAIKDVLAGRDLKLNEGQAREAIMAYQRESQLKLAEKNRKEGEAFLAENKKKPAVKTKSLTLPDGTSAELQYKVLTEGAGATPANSDMVSVNYRGTLVNGQEFDNSAKRGNQPAKFPVNGVVRGWTEALQMMKVGSKWEVYIPSALAYGDAGRPGIEPGSTLVFEMELVGIEAPPPPAPPVQPLTSDIIKVPSAEELKKGAKIEILKPEEAAKQAEAEAAKQAAAAKKTEGGAAKPEKKP